MLRFRVTFLTIVGRAKSQGGDALATDGNGNRVTLNGEWHLARREELADLFSRLSTSGRATIDLSRYAFADSTVLSEIGDAPSPASQRSGNTVFRGLTRIATDFEVRQLRQAFPNSGRGRRFLTLKQGLQGSASLHPASQRRLCWAPF